MPLPSLSRTFRRPYEAPLAPTAEAWADIRRQLERILTENIVPFWYPDVLDREYGGYHLNHGVRGEWLGPTNKSLVSQTGTLWFFSALARSPYGTDEHIRAARHGYEFLRDRLWDQESGGFFWEVDPRGHAATIPDKHVYGQGSAIFALSEYAVAASDPTAIELSRRLFGLLEEKAHDATHGGYAESFQRDWSPTPPSTTTLLGARPSEKLYNTHIHLMKSFIHFYLAAKDSLVRERLIELLLVQGNAVVRKTFGACTDRYRRDWTPILDKPHDRVYYGLDFANLSQLTDLCDALGIPVGPLADLLRTDFDYALRWGFDRRHGGFFEAGRLGTRADQREKVYWVQAEALVTALTLYHLTGNPAYFQCFSKTLEWVVTRQVDWERGEWLASINERGTPSGQKADRWKSGYHSARATILPLRLVSALERGETEVAHPARASVSPH